MAAKTGFEVQVVDPWALAWKELNDQGNADRLVAHAQGLLIYVRSWGWLAYEDGHWSRDDGERLARLKAMDVARGIRAEMEELEARLDRRPLPDGMTEEFLEGRIEALSKHATKSGDSSRTKAMLEQAANLDVLNRREEEFDADPLALNARNCTLRFRQGSDGWEVHDAPHDPVDLLTRQCAAEWRPDAKNDMWLKHMETVLPDKEVRWFFQKLIGYCATGLNVEQIFVILQGKGGDGKSTAMNAIRIVLGSYGVSGKVQTFLDGPDTDAGGATPELVRFVGDTRLISIQEPKRGKAMAEERVKQFTGGSPVPYRPLYGAESEFEPRGKVVMEANKRPRISGDDDGIWRRIIIMLWRHQFKGGAIVKGMHERILKDDPGGASGVLNWIIAGVIGYLNDGLEQPPEVVDAIEEYRRSANPFSEWAHAKLDMSDPLARELSADLYTSYKEWCEAEGLSDNEVMNSTRFGRALGDLQIIMCGKDSKGKKLRRGARLRRTNDLPAGSSEPIGDGGDEGEPL
ncbi:hypothetical protein CA233_18960 [Sphingomonas sp. ABOLD]|uniref:Putative DNA primase/helicase n=1 Tax=Sphingomonas trueperi TaxID=53317 RepID=A0A7X6BEJ0_9SPHN|nr:MULTISPECIES: phage/plasmid primase, P4 family [Sphingomonas]NJB99420.1 putative DNA primase/helicase [Sphingomonas trueperi]RSV34827.1 hypothetical protein CA234_20595 [Sphingomonas sp. ABOLE]RSV40921.1 hypothetical protein CA233_18960 [Sphingomonas sp. ABOLD]